MDGKIVVSGIVGAENTIVDNTTCGAVVCSFVLEFFGDGDGC